jgi:NADPH:quinone reductase-like Zn-dependent oxidoreductase
MLIQDEDGPRTRALTALLDTGTRQPVISHLLPLEAAAEAHRILESRHTGEKIVLNVAGS